MKKGIRKSIIVMVVSTLICSIGIGVFVQKNNTLKLSKEDIREKQAMTETKEFTEDDFPYNIKFKDIAVGDGFSVALDEEGYLWTWGRNRPRGTGYDENWNGALGRDELYVEKRIYPKKISGKKFSKIYANDGSAFAIDEEGYLYGWGRNDTYQLGDGTIIDKNVVTPIKPNLYFSSIDTSEYLTAAIDENGEIWIWGCMQYDQKTSNSSINSYGTQFKNPTKISNASIAKFIDIAVTNSSVAAIDENGNIWTYGYNGEREYYNLNGSNYYYLKTGVLGNNNKTNEEELVELTQITNSVVYKEIDAGKSYIIAKDEDNHLWAWGKGAIGIQTDDDVLRHTNFNY